MPISPVNRRGAAPVPLDADDALHVLARHQQRRRQQVPTVTVLAGRDDAPARLVRRFTQNEKRSVCEPFSLEQADAIECWFAACDARQTVLAAYKWLAGRAVCDPRILSSGMRSRSVDEQTMFLDRALAGKNVSPVDAVCRAIVEHAWQFGSMTAGLWERVIDACDGDLSRVTAGILALIGDQQTPVLLAVARTKEVVSLRTLMAKAASLASLAPSLPIIVSASPERIEEYLATTPECHALAVVREGVIWLDEDEKAAPAPAERRAAENGRGASQPGTQNRSQMEVIADLGDCVLAMKVAPGDEPPAAAEVVAEPPTETPAEPAPIAVDLGDCVLTLTSPSEGLGTVADAAAQAPSGAAAEVAPVAVDLGDCVLTVLPDPKAGQEPLAGPAELDDAARSAAERYLFERLQSHPVTAELFQLNGLLETPIGRPLEVDLLARGPRVAIEIDGYYHFTDADAYRRDREKDVRLQLAGYFVMRCLADDVVSRLEEILQTVLTAVRRTLPEPSGAGQGSSVPQASAVAPVERVGN